MSNTFTPDRLPPIGDAHLREIRRRLDGGEDVVVIARRSERGLEAGKAYRVTPNGGDGSSLSLTSFGEFCAPWSWRSGWIEADLLHFIWPGKWLHSSQVEYLRWRVLNGWHTSVSARQNFRAGRRTVFTKGRAYRIVVDEVEQKPYDLLLTESLVILTDEGAEIPRHLLTLDGSGLQYQPIEPPPPDSPACDSAPESPDQAEPDTAESIDYCALSIYELIGRYRRADKEIKNIFEALSKLNEEIKY